MDEFAQSLQQTGFQGDIDTAAETLETYSHDASMFEIRPQVVVSPKDATDVERVVKLVAERKSQQPDLSITARSAGTDMSGGAINDSIIMDFKKYFTAIHEITPEAAHAQPGVFYR